MVLDVLSLVVGVGMLAMLFRLGQQLGSLSARLATVAERVGDHEDRLRGLEHRPRT